jgi:hypothetical protein
VAVVKQRRFAALQFAAAAALAGALFFGVAWSASASADWIVQVDHAANGHVEATVLTPTSAPVTVHPPGLTPIQVGNVNWGGSTNSCAPREFPDTCVTVSNSSMLTEPFMTEPVPSHRVILRAVPDAGYFFQGWTVTGSGGAGLNPCGDDPVCEIPFQQRADVTPIFSSCPTGQQCLTVVTTPSGTGTVAASNGATPLTPDVSTGTLSTYYVHNGDQIKLVPAGAAGAVLSTWSGCTENPADKSCSLTISGTSTVTATFANQITVNKSDVNGPSTNLMLAAFDTHGQYIDDQAGDGCVFQVTVCVYMLPPGGSYHLQRFLNLPTDNANYHTVLSWDGCTPQTVDDFCDLTSAGSFTVTAYDKTYWSWHVQQGAHGTITSSPGGFDCGPRTNSCDALFPVGSTVGLTSTAEPGYTSAGFDGGVVDVVPSSECPAVSPTCSVTLDHAPLTIGANVWPNIEVDASGPNGQIAWLGSGPFVSCGTETSRFLCRAYAPGGSPRVGENAISPSTFGGWSGGGCSGTASTCSPSSAAPATISAQFIGNVIISAIATGSGAVSVSPTPFACGGANKCFTSGTVVTVTETATGTGAFFQWSGGPCNATGVKTCTFTIQSDTSLNASFTSGQLAHVSVVGGGSVSSAPGGIDNCTAACDGYLAFGSSIAFTATPAPGWAFSGWSGATSTSNLGVQQTCSGTGACHLFVGTPIATYALSLTATFTQLDSTPPTIVFDGTSPGPNGSGWNNTTVTSTWTCTDTGSGPQAPTVTQSLASDGAGQQVAGTCTDIAGNPATDTEGTVNIDKTAPAASATPSRGADSGGWYNHAFTVTWGGTDALSGIDTCGGDAGYAGADRATATLNGSCADKAGNVGAGTFSFEYDATPPTISLVSRTPANGSGWNKSAVTVTWSCVDVLSGAVLATVQQTVATEGANQSATGVCTDAAGNVSTNTVSGIYVDVTPPSVSVTPVRAADGGGWYTHPVSASWSGSDALSGGVTCSAAQTYSGPDTSGTTLSGSCTDAAGNSSSGSLAIKYDSTAPVVSLTSRTAANGHGWNNAPVTVAWSCTDSGSGAVSTTVTHTLSGDGAGQTSTGTCTDAAGNSASDVQTGIDIDQTAPTVSGGASVAADANGWRSAPFSVHWSAVDGGAGVDTCAADATVSTEGASGSVTGTCTDFAGNIGTAVFGYKLDTESPTLTVADVTLAASNAGVTVPSYSNVSATDNLGTPTVTCTPAAPHVFPGGQTTPVSCTATDAAGSATTHSFNVQVPGLVDLSTTAGHSGSFTRGDTADILSLVVKNAGFLGTSGTVTAVDALPAGLTASAITGAGWTCTLATLTCTRADALAPGASYPAISVTVGVAASTADTATNRVTVSGGGEQASLATDDTAIDAISIVSQATPPTPTPALPAAPSTGSVTKTVEANAAGSVSVSGTATVTWAPNALPPSTSVSLAPTPAASAGSTSLGVGATVVSVVATAPDGTPIHTLAQPLEIDFPNAPADFVPQTSEDGTTWRAIALIASGGSLPAGQPDGYLRVGTTVEVFTRHLTLFAIAAAPTKAAAPLVVKTSATLIRSRRVLTVVVATTLQTHVALDLRRGGKQLGHWHRWVTAGKTTLRLYAPRATSGRSGYVLRVTAAGGGTTKASIVSVRMQP